MTKKLIFIIIGSFITLFLLYKYLDYYYEEPRCLGFIPVINNYNYRFQFCRNLRFRQYTNYSVKFINSVDGKNKTYYFLTTQEYYFPNDFEAKYSDSIVYITYKTFDNIIFFLNLKTRETYSYYDERTFYKENDSILKKLNSELAIE